MENGRISGLPDSPNPNFRMAQSHPLWPDRVVGTPTPLDPDAPDMRVEVILKRCIGCCRCKQCDVSRGRRSPTIGG